MKPYALLAAALACFSFVSVACSSSEESPAPGGGQPGQSATPTGGTGTAPAATGTTPPSTTGDSGTTTTTGDSGSPPGTCAEPQGATCPTTAGNCKGIGTPCTKGGGECNAAGLNCDKDLDSKGVGICISIMKCTPGKKECGAGASCCMGPDTTFIGVCMPNVCLLDSCTPE